MKTKLRKLLLHRRILKDLTVKQLKAKYSGTTLGFSLAIIIPLILALSISFIFSVIFKVHINNFSLFVLSAIIPWMFFSTALSEATNSIVGNLQILKQVTFPREILPISTVLADFLNFLFGFVVLLPLFISAHFKVLMFLPFLIYFFVLQLIFTVGLGLLLASLNVFFRDLNHFVPVSLMIWFWMTPIFYGIEMIPRPYRWICLLNPMTYYIIPYRQILFEAKLPDFFMSVSAFLIAIASLAMGYFVFSRKESLILKRL